MILNRRKFLWGLGAAVAAPAVVKASNLMPVKTMPELPPAEKLIPEIAEINRMGYGRAIAFATSAPAALYDADGKRLRIPPKQATVWEFRDDDGEVIRYEVPPLRTLT
ncbi:MAG: hypothetical protein KDC85_24425, partial [Saprospiraceae bacterium]|nr:hypothetical protein [Saprospiraceae bacterium]